MKKEYIKPKIIIIKTCNDDALLQTVSLYDIGNDKPIENIAGEGGEGGEGGEPDTGEGGFIWND
ncbi:hypothetical protein [Prevotella sp. B2-R-102]|uniref:hypothetical protein n=1 Tax=Segatella intestinalis TaxID=3035284 RepID=UPI0023EC371C|nr:hypothetical protein [Prevotella sp. B2-R-102]MDF4241730.1 hypothetical protein [Prevotella sp. B2-R-102]